MANNLFLPSNPMIFFKITIPPDAYLMPTSVQRFRNPRYVLSFRMGK